MLGFESPRSGAIASPAVVTAAAASCRSARGALLARRGAQRRFFGELRGIDADGVDRRHGRRAGGVERVERLRVGDELLHERRAAVGVALADDVRRVGELDEARVPADLARAPSGTSDGRRPRVEFAARAPAPAARPGSSGSRPSVGGWATVGLGQSRQAVYASVFSSWASHSAVLNGLNVDAGSAASAAASCWCAHGRRRAHVEQLRIVQARRPPGTARPNIRAPARRSTPRLRRGAARTGAAAAPDRRRPAARARTRPARGRCACPRRRR